MADDWTTNDYTLYLPPKSHRSPSFVAQTFLEALLGLEDESDHLEAMVTPQSRCGWGDFRGAQSYMQSIQSAGISSKHSRPVEARDVAYVPVMTGTSAGYVLPAGTPTFPEAVVTLVWHEDADSWLVHSIGDFVPPEVLERPSIGLVPEES